MSSSTPQDPTRSGAQPNQRRRRGATRPKPTLWHCPNCDAMMAVEVREGHTCHDTTDSPPPSNDSPLDQFFLSYPLFTYHRSLPPAESFKRLQRNQRWKRDDPQSSDAWDQYQNALKEEFQLWYSAEDDLSAWHALCRAIRIKPLPPTCKGCKKVSSIHDML
jgi:hypothetical protein